MKTCECGKPVHTNLVTKELFCALSGFSKNQLRHRIYGSWTEGVEYVKVDGTVMINAEMVEKEWAEKLQDTSGRRATILKSSTRKRGNGSTLGLV